MAATGFVGGDPAKVSRTGDSMSGDLVLDDDSPAASEAYVAAHAGAGFYLEFVQASPSSNWGIAHGFGIKPNVSILDTDDGVVINRYTHLDDNTVNITFPAPFAGKAVLTA